MLVISLLVCTQQSIERFQTRRKLAGLTPLQLRDIGMTKEHQQAEVAQATLSGLLRDLFTLMKNTRG